MCNRLLAFGVGVLVMFLSPNAAHADIQEGNRQLAWNISHKARQFQHLGEIKHSVMLAFQRNDVDDIAALHRQSKK